MTTTTGASAIDTLLDRLGVVALGDARVEVQKLRAIRDWAIEALALDYKVGDRVTIVSKRPSTTEGGWENYREALAVGQSGIVRAIDFNPYRHHWQVIVGMDRLWSVGDDMQRYWYGPAKQCPPGFKLSMPSRPEGSVVDFAFRLDWVAKHPRDLDDE